MGGIHDVQWEKYYKEWIEMGIGVLISLSEEIALTLCT